MPVEREAFAQLRVHALEAACDMLAKAGRFDACHPGGTGYDRGRSLRESARRSLIRAYLAESKPSLSTCERGAASSRTAYGRAVVRSMPDSEWAILWDEIEPGHPVIHFIGERDSL